MPRSAARRISRRATATNFRAAGERASREPACRIADDRHDK
jgi:hypothetical protein